MEAEEASMLRRGKGISVVKESALVHVGWETNSKMGLDVLKPSSKKDHGQVQNICQMWV